MIKIIAILLLVFVATLWLVSTFIFSSVDHSQYDLPRPKSANASPEESKEHKAEAKIILNAYSAPPPAKGREMIRFMREQMDERGVAADINAEILKVDVDGVPAEWVIAPNADHNRRMLYIHGGGYMIGSRLSARPITGRLSEIANAAILVIDYRLMPENPRMAGIVDSRNAYKWLLENGPNGRSELTTLIVAGDSAGGNLALATIAWARDTGVRPADAVVTMSPQTDATLESPSLITNIDTDVMQGQSFGPFVKAPKIFSMWLSFLTQRINPNNPIVSPLLGDLSNLPPTLIQASESEMFLDDAVRYNNKANSQGSLTVLETWPAMMHIWQAFSVPEAEEAFVRIGQFLNTHTSAD